MKKTSKFLSVFLALIMVITIIPMSSITARAASSGACGDNLTWTFNEKTGILTISGTGDMYDYSNMENTKSWERYGESITKIVINEGVTSIGDYAFSNCSYVNDVKIPDSVTTIGDRAFAFCFYLSNITIPDGVKKIGCWAFAYCQEFTSIAIPDSVEEIADEVFYCCYYLEDVTIGNGVKKFGEDVFAYCDSLITITVNSNNQYYASDENGVLFNKDKTTLIKYPAGNPSTSYVIPKSVTTIIDDAFYSCSDLTDVSIPDSVTFIGDLAFYDCENLASVTIPKGVTFIGDSAFSGCFALKNFTVDSNNQYFSSDGNGVLFNKDKTTLVKYPLGNDRTSYTIPDSVTKIGHYAFTFSENLVNIVIPNSVETIDYGAFSNCIDLASIKIPDSVVSIETYAFFDCISLENVVVGKGVKTIGMYAFDYCSSLKSITIPDGVTVIETGAFVACENLKYVYYYGTEDDWNNVIIKDDNEPLNNASIHFNVKNESDIFTFEISEPSNTYLRNRDGIVLHTTVGGNVPDGSYVIWSSDNNNFKEKTDENDLQVIAKNNGYTTFTARLCDADGKVIAMDSVELYSRSSFFDKIGGFFRGLFGLTNIRER